MANRAATKEAAGPESLKRLEENKGGREKGGGEEKGEDWRKKEGRYLKFARIFIPRTDTESSFFFFTAES